MTGWLLLTLLSSFAPPPQHLQSPRQITLQGMCLSRSVLELTLPGSCRHLFVGEQPRVSQQSKLCPLFVNYSHLFNTNNTPDYLRSTLSAAA